MSIQTLISATPLLAPSSALSRPLNTQNTQNPQGADSAAASFSRMLAQARQGTPAPAPVAAPAPTPAPQAAAAPPASPAPKAAPDDAPANTPANAGPAADSQNPATTEPVQPTDADGSSVADTRKPPERSPRGGAVRGGTRTERPAAGDDAAQARPADKAADDGAAGAAGAGAGAVPPPWLGAPPQADAALAGLSRANQTTPVPSADAADEKSLGAALEAGTGQDTRAQAAGAARDARKAGEPGPAGERLAKAAAGEQSFAGALAAATEPTRAAAAEPLQALREAGAAVAPGGSAPVTAAAGDTPAPVQASLATPVTSPEFRAALGVQVSVLARDGVEHAELQLNPSDMGPISVRISMEGDQARVDFGADLARTRDAIQAGWAELAASLQDAGFTLSGGGVSQHSAGRNGADGSGAGNGDGTGTRGGTGARNIAAPDEVSMARAPRTTVRVGGVDLFA